MAEYRGENSGVMGLRSYGVRENKREMIEEIGESRAQSANCRMENKRQIEIVGAIHELSHDLIGCGIPTRFPLDTDEGSPLSTLSKGGRLPHRPPLGKVGSKGGLQKTASNMEKVYINLDERSYPVFIGENLLSEIGVLISEYELSQRIAIISNPTVWRLYGNQAIKSLKAAGFSPVKIIIPDGERYKNLKTVEGIYTQMLKAGIDRKGCIVALGGGVIGDIAGFVSATYMRGIKYIQVPTTLLAQVDASIGGKTGVDHRLGKNLIGAFHQPLSVLSDISTLRTLPEREFRASLAEVIKYGIIRDAELFDFMKKERERVLARERDALIYIVKSCSNIKAEIVEKDEREETGIRSILNFGHTIGHAIESATCYRKYLHGEAVAMGMVMEARISDVLTGLNLSSQVSEAINRYFYFEKSDINMKGLLSFIQYDKKRLSDTLKVFLLREIGEVSIDSIEIKKFKKIIKMEV